MPDPSPIATVVARLSSDASTAQNIADALAESFEAEQFAAAYPEPAFANSQNGQQPYSLLVHSMALVRELRFRPGLRVSSRLVGVLHRAVPSAAPSRRGRESDRFLAQIEKTPRTSADDNVFLSRARRHGPARYRLGPQRQIASAHQEPAARR